MVCRRSRAARRDCLRNNDADVTWPQVATGGQARSRRRTASAPSVWGEMRAVDAGDVPAAGGGSTRGCRRGDRDHRRLPVRSGRRDVLEPGAAAGAAPGRAVGSAPAGLDVVPMGVQPGVSRDARGRARPVLRAVGPAGRHARPDRVWAYRQQLVFELGGLGFFVRRMAGSALLARADQVETWPQAPMGGFEFIEPTPSTTSWLDLASGEFSTPNIGSAVLLQPGDRVIGRLVPVEAGSMFESRPLGVPATVAQEWPRRRRGGRSSCGRPGRAGVAPGCSRPTVRESLVTDVLPWVWQLALLDPELLDSGDDPEELPTNETAARAVLDAAASSSSCSSILVPRPSSTRGHVLAQRCSSPPVDGAAGRRRPSRPRSFASSAT